MTRSARLTPAAEREGQSDLFRVWPDGTVQAAEDGAPYSWMSDDYELVLAVSEDDARTAADGSSMEKEKCKP